VGLVYSVIFSIIIVWPIWRIFQKTGQLPALSLLVLIPVVGPAVVALIFGRGRWPNAPGGGL
jgi:hypothetical protein